MKDEGKINALIEKARGNGLDDEAIKTILKKHGTPENKIQRLLESKKVGKTQKSTEKNRIDKKKEEDAKPKTDKQSHQKKEHKKSRKEQQNPLGKHKAKRPKSKEKKEPEKKKAQNKKAKRSKKNSKKQNKENREKSKKHQETRQKKKKVTKTKNQGVTVKKTDKPKKKPISESRVRKVAEKAKARGIRRDKVSNILTRKKVPKKMQTRIITDVYGKESAVSSYAKSTHDSKDLEEVEKTQPQTAKHSEKEQMGEDDKTPKNVQYEKGGRESSVEYDPNRASLNVNTISVTGAETPPEEYKVVGLDDVIYKEKEKTEDEIDEKFRSENETPQVPGFEE